ncbi:hypothetical protein SORBI_3001G133100, partial [Sorghum bicolor]
MSECYSGKMSGGDRCDDGKRSDRMMMDGISKRSAAHGNKHAAAGTKLPSVKQQDDKTRSRRWSLKRRRMAAASPLMVWIIIAAHVIPLVQCGYITVDVITEVFDLTKRPHAEIFGIIHAIAADAMPRLEVQGHRYLGAKDLQPSALGGDGSGPARWIKIPFQGETEEDRVTIALPDSTLYLLAFMNNVGTWHCFKGCEEWFPDCVVLNSGLDERGKEWDESYPDLIKGGVEMLHTVPLGKNSDLEATRLLGRYRHGISPLTDLKSGLVRKILMYPEALRIRLVRETFSGDLWETETYISSDLEPRIFQNWGRISYLLYRSDSDG